MVTRCAVVIALLLPVVTHVSADVTGTWGGSASFNDFCEYTDAQGRLVRVPFSGTVNITLNLLQAGGLVNGTVEVDNIPNNTSTCQVSGTLPPLIGPLSGTLSGSTLTLTATLPKDNGVAQKTFTATVSGNSMAFSVAGGVVSGTLTQTSTTPPASGLTGTYNGTFAATFVPCGKLAPISFSGTITAGLIQAGSSLTGSATISNDKQDREDASGNCTVTDRGPSTNLLSAQISGSSIVGVTFDEKGKANPFVATINGNTISGSETHQDFPGESFTFTMTRSSTGAPGPVVSSFAANPSSIDPGQSSTLSWSTINATSASIDNGVGAAPIGGSVSVSPRQTTTYALTATGPGGSATATATVTVSAPTARVIIGNFPTGMLQATGGTAATDSFTLANVGSAPANVTLTQSGNFFTVSPASSTLQAGGSQIVNIQATTQPAGSYVGSVTVSGDGLPSGGAVVPVRLLVATPPTTAVSPQPGAGRVEVSAPADQNPTGSVAFTNSGTGTVQAIAISDVPWIVPQSGAITIAPGQTVQVSFTIDRSKRPDSASLIGGAAGKISLVFLLPVTPKSPVALGNTPTGSVSVTIVDVVKPGLSAGSPPALQSGEVALFVAGHGSTAGLASDILVSNRSSSTISDLRLFLPASAQFAGLPQLLSNAGLTLPSASTNIFGVESGGSMQLRSSSAANVSVSAIRMVNPNGSAEYVSAVPIFRSDRGIGPGQRLVLSGVEQTSSSRTVIFVQELSGNAASADLQAYDNNGAPIGSKTSLSINAFAAPNDGGSTVTTGAQSVAITNTSSGSRIDAYARVVDNSTGDAWMVVDPSASSDALIMPLFPQPAGAAQSDIYITNKSGATVNANTDVMTVAPRRHAVRSTSLEGTASRSLQPLQTDRSTMTPAIGYVRISAPAGSISAAGRLTITAQGRFGSALPVVPTSDGLVNGQSKRFTGVDDASAASVAARAPATFRAALLLIETAGQNATVRVTLRYTFQAGGLVSSQAVSSKDFPVGAGQVVLIGDLARSVIGSQRDSFGDLRNMQVDVSVIDGGGTVLSFLQSTENGTGDVMVRAE